MNILIVHNKRPWRAVMVDGRTVGKVHLTQGTPRIYRFRWLHSDEPRIFTSVAGMKMHIMEALEKK